MRDFTLLVIAFVTVIVGHSFPTPQTHVSRYSTVKQMFLLSFLFENSWA